MQPVVKMLHVAYGTLSIHLCIIVCVLYSILYIVYIYIYTCYMWLHHMVLSVYKGRHHIQEESEGCQKENNHAAE